MMLQRNWNRPVEGMYERERLRRRARTLGLHLVKPKGQRSQQKRKFAQPKCALHSMPARDNDQPGVRIIRVK
jgi:hypothetical protein